MEKTEEEFNKAKEQFEKFGKIASEALPKFEKLRQRFTKVFEDLKPNDSKNIKLDNINCVAMLFDDKVTIQFANGQQTQKYYDEIMKEKKIKIFDWWKQIFKK